MDSAQPTPAQSPIIVPCILSSNMPISINLSGKDRCVLQDI